MSFTATADTTYQIRVTGAPAIGCNGLPEPGSGPVSVGVTTSDGQTQTAGDILAFPNAVTAQTNKAVLDDTFTVPTTGTYQVALNDLQMPAGLSAAGIAVFQGSTVVASNFVTSGAVPTQLLALGSGGSSGISLSAGTTYQLIAEGIEASGSSGGLFSVVITPQSGGSIAYGPKYEPIGSVVQLGSALSLDTGVYTLTLADLQTPNALQNASAVVASNGQASAPAISVPAAGAGSGSSGSCSGSGSSSSSSSSSSGSTGTNCSTLTLNAGTFQVFAAATPAATGPGSYAVTLQNQGGGAPSLSLARAVVAAGESSPGAPAAYSYDTTLANGGSYSLDLKDFQFPNSFTSLQAVVAQNGAVLGSILPSSGTQSVSPQAGPVSILVFATPSATSGSLFGVDLTASGSSAPAFEATEGVGTAFASAALSITSSGTYSVSLNDLKFPAKFDELGVAITQGAQLLGSVYGGDSIPSLSLPAGDYTVNLFAQPGGSEQAGTFSATVVAGPPAPTVNLSTDAASVASGGTVHIIYSTANATSCQASSEPTNSSWSGNITPSSTSVSVLSGPLTESTTFTLTCTNAEEASTTQNVTVTISTSQGKGGGGAFGFPFLLVLAGLAALRVLSGRRTLIGREPLRSGAAPIVIAAVTSLTLLAGCSGSQSRLASHVERGKSYYEHGDFGRASVEFRNAMQIAPKDPDARLWAGRAAEKLGRLRDAAGLFQSVLELSPDDESAQVELGRLYDSVGAPKLALKIAQSGLAKHPNDVELLAVRGLARARLDDPKGAREDAERAVQLDPLNERAVALLAAIDRDDGQLARARELLRKTLQQIPHSKDLREVLLDIDVRLKDFAEAEHELEGLISEEPAELKYRTQLAQLYVQSNRVDDARKALESAVKALPRSDDAKLLLVDFVSTSQSRQDGEKLLRAFISQTPDDYRLRLGLGSLLERAQATDAAVAAYNEIVRRDGDGPDAISARDRIARIDLVRGRLDEAQKEVAAVLHLNPQDDEALAIRGSLALERNDPQAAITDLRAVVRDEPGSTRAHRLLAEAYSLHHEPQLAEDELRSAVESAPQDAALRIDLADFYAKSKRPDDGIKILQGGVRQLPSSVPLRAALVRAYLAKGDLADARKAADDFEKALPQAAEGYYLAGIVAQADKRWADSEHDYEQALAITPTFAPAAALTRLELARGEGKQAIADLKRLSDRNPKSALALEMLGEVYIANKDYARATDALSRAIAADPAWWYPYRNLAVCKAAQGDVAGAVAAYQAGLRAAPESSQLALELTSYYIRHNRYDDAIALYDGLYRRDPQSQLAASNLALLLATYRTDRESLDRARALVSRFASANDGALLDVRGWVSLKLGEVQQALPVLEHAVAREPDSKLVHFHLAMAELEAGQRDRARAELETALAGSGSFPGAEQARSTLASLEHKAG